MQRQQILFGTVTSLILIALGALLSISGLANWSLALVGTGTLALSVASWVYQAREQQAQLVPTSASPASQS